MTENEALKELNLQSIVLKRRVQANREIEEFVSSALLEQRKNAIDIAIKALKKQVPKKPKEKFVDIEIYNSGGFTKKEARKYCPVCKAGLTHETFCYKCGQKLDWEGGE